jgi:hypothetical protein
MASMKWPAWDEHHGIPAWKVAWDGHHWNAAVITKTPASKKLSIVHSV